MKPIMKGGGKSINASAAHPCLVSTDVTSEIDAKHLDEKSMGLRTDTGMQSSKIICNLDKITD